MLILIELLSISVQGIENTNFNILFSCLLWDKCGVSSVKQGVESGLVIIKKIKEYEIY